MGRTLLISVGAGWAHKVIFVGIICYSELWSLLLNTCGFIKSSAFEEEIVFTSSGRMILNKSRRLEPPVLYFLVHFQVTTMNCLTFEGVEHPQGKTPIL